MKTFYIILALFYIVLFQGYSYAEYINLEEDSEEKFSKKTDLKKAEKAVKKNNISKNKISTSILLTSEEYILSTSNSMNINFLGSGYEFRMSYERLHTKKYGLSANLSQKKYTFSDVSSGISPGTVEVSDNKIEIELQYNPALLGQYKWHFLTGIRYKSRDAAKNNPIQVTDMKSYSLSLGLRKWFKFTSKSDLGVLAKLYPYKTLEESSSTSGDYSSTLEYNIQLKSNYKYSNKLTFNAFYEMQYMQNKYIGLGTRGTQDASVTQSSHSFGLGLAYAF